MLKIIEKPIKTTKSKVLDLFSFAIIFFVSYLLVMPAYPILADQLTFKLNREATINLNENINNSLTRSHFPLHQDKEDITSQAIINFSEEKNDNNIDNLRVNNLVNNSPQKIDNIESKRELVIEKIGVKAPIIETDNEKEGLAKGAWLYPGSAKPSEIGNTIISAHRYKYLPPHNITFYSLDKLILGDEIIVNWEGKVSVYLVKEIKVVEANDKSVVEQSSDSLITLITCHPIFTTEKRLIVIGEKIR